MNFVNGVYQWEDGKITAASIRDDMFERCGVRLLQETFFLHEAEELANTWNYNVRFVTIDEWRRLDYLLAVSYEQIVGPNISKVTFYNDNNTYYYIAKEV